MKTIILNNLGENYRIKEPICVEVTAIEDNGYTLYWTAIKNLQNDLVFGVGRTINSAVEMLRQLLIEYYETLLSCDFDRYYGKDLIKYELDKQYLQRKIYEGSI